MVELRAAQSRAESAEAQARELEGALAQFESTLAHTLGANSRAATEAASRIGLLEAQNSRLTAEYSDLTSKFEALSERCAPPPPLLVSLNV
jgi:chromosome segregation ATPase